MNHSDKLLRIKKNIIEYKQYTLAAYVANILINQKIDQSHIKDLELLVLNSLDYGIIKNYFDSVKYIILKDKFENYFLFR